MHLQKTSVSGFHEPWYSDTENCVWEHGRRVEPHQVKHEDLLKLIANLSSGFQNILEVFCSSHKFAFQVITNSGWMDGFIFWIVAATHFNILKGLQILKGDI